MVGVPIQQVKSYDCVQKSTKQSPKFKFFTPLLAEVIKTTCLRSVAIRFALSSLVLAMGCVPEERVLPSKSTIPAIEITQSEQLYWWPGHMLRNGEVVDISLGFKEVTGFPHNFISTNEISGEVRDYEKSNLQATLDFIKFFLNEDVFSTIMANNIFTFLNPKGIDNISGLYKSGVYGFSLVDQGGEEFAGCFKACPNYDLILIKQEGSRVLLHESLHDAWSSYLTDEEKKYFTEKLQLFFSVAGESNNADQLLGAIWNSYRHTNRENPNESESFGFTANLKGPELDEWAATELSGYDTVAVSAMQQAIRDYFRIRSMVTFNRALSHTGSQRNSFIVREGFAYLGTNLYNGTNELYAGSGSIEFKFIPGFMQSDYSILLKNPLLSTMVNDGSGHFSTVDDFKNFIPYVQSFVDWMKRRYPVLNDLGQ